jgi:RNA methyltransferase, TrmH family
MSFNMKTISSRQNPEIIALAKLHKANERYAQQRFIAEGVRTCSTLIETGQTLLQLYVTEPMLAQAQTMVSPTLITIISEPVLQKISHTTSPSGLIGVFSLPKPPLPEHLETGIVLDGIADPGNMGTLIRTCAAMAKKTVIVLEGVDPWNQKVIQASVGTIGSVNIFQWSWQELLRHKKSMSLIALVVKDGTPINQLSLKNSLLVIGSEAHGINDKRLLSCDKQVSLEMPGNVESLNAAVAGSIAMYLAWAS